MVGVRSGGGLRQIQDLFAGGVVGHLTDAQLLDRFTRGHDAEAAFEALVVRHGPAVLRACRRSLRDSNDADDAFQATFLVLARRARAVGSPDSLASWLYGVALRVSRKANIATTRRRRHEQLAPGGRIPDREPLHEIISIVREEIALLPEPLRLPVHLCYLEGETYEVAARHLRVTEATIRGRLARARKLLRGCLSRRGVGVPKVLPSLFATKLVTRPVPFALVRATTRSATSIAQGCRRLVGVSAFVSELTEGVLLNMIVTKLKTAALVVAALGFAVTGGITLKEHRPQDTEAEGGRVHPEPPSHRIPKIGQSHGDGASLVAIHSERNPEEEDAARLGATSRRTPFTITLDTAVERMIRESLDSSSKFSIPLEQAEILTAGVWSNPEHDPRGQRVTDGVYTKSRHDDQTHFDTNVSYPPQVWLKRRARILDAKRPKRVMEAQYQDVVRVLIGDVYTKCLDVQTAQEKVRLASESSVDFSRNLGVTLAQATKGIRSQKDVDQIQAALRSAGSRFDAATADLERTKHVFGALLKLSAGQADRLEVVGSLDVQPVSLPAIDELTRLALETRPDIAAFRLGLHRMQSELATTQTPNVYTVYQPYAWKVGTPSALMGPTTWALGITVPVPNYAPNKASRARLNLDQTQVQLTQLERQATSDVTRARREYELNLAEVTKIEHEVLPSARQVRNKLARAYDDGQLGVETILKCLQDYREVEHNYIDLLTRLRRNSLYLNTAVGSRIMP
jgi:outer membrane protein, heavy metal efflux system